MSRRLATALRETFGIELLPTDVITFEHNYCEYTMVDVIITDTKTGEEFICELFDTTNGIFPY